MTTRYKLIQLTNSAVGAVAVNDFLPLGNVTRRINAPCETSETFQVTSSIADTVTVTEPGFYKVTYSLTATTAGAGVVTIGLITNGTQVYEVSNEVATEDTTVNFTLPYTIRVCPNSCATPTNCPVTVQLQCTGEALTGTSSNLIIEKVH